MKSKGILFVLPLLLVSCQKPSPSLDQIKVMIEPDDSYVVDTPLLKIERGSDATFHVRMNEGYLFDACSYENYQVITSGTQDISLTFMDVKYSMVVSIYTKKENKKDNPNSSSSHPSSSINNSSTIEESSIVSSGRPLTEIDLNYHAGTSSFISTSEESIAVSYKGEHLRTNALNGYEYLKEKTGYQFDCWNTKADGSGENVYFGSKVPYDTTDLYPVYLEESPSSDFTFSLKHKGYEITSYVGNDTEVVIPATYEGQPVVSIGYQSFENKSVKKIHLSKNIGFIKPNAFLNSSLEEITFVDNLENIFDTSFTGSNIKTVHINAIRKPVGSGTYYDTFTNKIDYLDMVKDEKKIILFSGSSTRYGYDSTLMEAAYPDYKVVNMGVFAYVNIKPQIEVIKHYLKSGDIFINSPEFDYWCLDCQFGSDTQFEKNLFYFFEGNFNCLQYIDISKYDDFFNSFRSFQGERNLLPTKDYSYNAYHYDDDNVYYDDEIYNINGDLILYRPNNDADERISQPETPYTTTVFTQVMFDSLNAIYLELGIMGVDCYFTYAPKNIRSLTVESDSNEIQKLGVMISQKIQVPILGDIFNSLLPGTCFYLIDNHLSTEYAGYRTQDVISWLTSERQNQQD